MANQRITTVVESIRANLRAADWGIELYEQMIRADGVPVQVVKPWNSVRDAITEFDAVCQEVGKIQSQKLNDALPEHESKGSV